MASLASSSALQFSVTGYPNKSTTEEAYFYANEVM